LKTPSVLEGLKSFLDSRGIAYRSVHHEPTRTSEESAKARGEDIAIGGKAILMKVDDEFKLFVLSAAKKIDSHKIKARFGVKKLRFATPEELQQLTGLVPGSVPPFGRPILPFDLYVDTSITLNEKIAFNAGSLMTSIIMSCRDYLSLAGPEIFDFSSVNQ
jgi:prolyl-tRNA editing enzyme YbaK/EbsC (Cys-tRNA(Pro) deacylase)